MKGNLREIATARMTAVSDSLGKQGPAPCLPFLLQLPNLLALDAAFFALCWQWMATKAFGFETFWIHGALVATAVWLGYTADRWLDVSGMQNAPSTRRHKFAARHRKGLLVAWAMVFVFSLLVAWQTLSTEEFQVGLILAVLCATNASLNHADPKGRFPVPKECRAALLLSAGIHLFLWVRMPESTPSLWFSFATVTVLCFLNCCLVAKWETEIDLCQGQSSLALRRKKVETVAVKVTLATIVLCPTMALFRPNEPEALMLLATALALFALPFIDRCGLDPEDKRILADAVLFIPCLALI